MIQRHLIPNLLEAVSDTPVVMLHGARQTGKSTLVRHVAQGDHPARYLSLDDATVLAGARSDPAGFLAGLDGNLVFDEVQRAPELFLAIKAEVDRDRRPGRFLLTGSANAMLIPRLSDALVGRMQILTLWPFAQDELDGRRSRFIDRVFADSLPSDEPQTGERAQVIKRMLAGGYLEALARKTPQRRREWFGSYVATILQRDVRDLSQIEGLAVLPRILSLIAARSGSTVNLAEMSRSLALPSTTLKRYLALLEATFLVQPLPAWSGGMSKRLVKAPKLMLGDTGLMAYALNLSEARLSAEPTLIGAVLENFVVMELRKQAAWSQALPQMYYYRTHANEEVDLVLEDGSGRVVGIEVKAAGAVNAHDFKGLRSLSDNLGDRFVRGMVLYLGAETVPFGARLCAAPVSAVWRTITMS